MPCFWNLELRHAAQNEGSDREYNEWRRSEFKGTPPSVFWQKSFITHLIFNEILWVRPKFPQAIMSQKRAKKCRGKITAKNAPCLNSRWSGRGLRGFPLLPKILSRSSAFDRTSVEIPFNYHFLFLLKTRTIVVCAEKWKKNRWDFFLLNRVKYVNRYLLCLIWFR